MIKVKGSNQIKNDCLKPLFWRLSLVQAWRTSVLLSVLPRWDIWDLSEITDLNINSTENRGAKCLRVKCLWLQNAYPLMGVSCFMKIRHWIRKNLNKTSNAKFISENRRLRVKSLSEYSPHHKENIRIYLECHCFSTQWVTNNHEAMSNNHHLINLRKKIKGDPSTA